MNREVQVRFCERLGVKFFRPTRHQSGTKQSRPALDRMMKDARDGFIAKVIVYSFSRYARSVTHLLRALEEFKKLEIGFISLTENIDTNTPLGSAVFTILGAVAQLERDLIAERVRNGLANAKAKGIHIGRIKMRDSDLIRKLLSSKMTYREIARIAKCSTGAVSAEVRAMKAEAVVNAKNIALAEALSPKLEVDNKNSFDPSKVVTGSVYQGKIFDFESQDGRIELER